MTSTWHSHTVFLCGFVSPSFLITSVLQSPLMVSLSALEAIHTTLMSADAYAT